MGKAKYSPSTILTKAMEVYLREDNITVDQILKDKSKATIRLNTVAFAMRTILSYYGYRITTEIGSFSIIVKSAGIPCYIIEDNQIYGIKNISSLSFQLVIHWGAISNELDKMGQVPDEIITGTIQTSLAI